MGCASLGAVEVRKILPLPPETTNSYLDKFPAIVLMKIKEKFMEKSQPDSGDMTLLAFLELFATAKLNEKMGTRLFRYFNDGRSENLSFRRFMIKYATILKSEMPIFSKIIFELYKENPDATSLNELEFNELRQGEARYLRARPEPPQLPVEGQELGKWLEQADFSIIEYQEQLMIISEEDIPFQAIRRQLKDDDMQDIEPGQDYYILSNAWFERWSFYYLEADHTLERFKSTKMLQDSSTIRRKKKTLTYNEGKPRGSILSTQFGNSLVEQPNQITFEEIEGEYWGELKAHLKTSAQLKVVSKALWKILKGLHPVRQSFKRKGLEHNTLEFYPKAVYLAKTDHKGNILVDSQLIKMVSLSEPAGSLASAEEEGKESYLFTKNFGEKNWREVEKSRLMAEISLDPRLLMVATSNRDGFVEKHMRKEKSSENIELGDSVYTHFAYIKSHCEAHVVRLEEEDRFKVHFIGYSYHYEAVVRREDIAIQEDEAIMTSAKKKHETVLKGMNNVGNTCFINAVIQCLITTPILENFLLKHPFNEKDNPIGSGLSVLARSLLNNEKPSASEFKKIVDVRMSQFSGYDQQDAQEFLNLLLEKVSDELGEKPSIIEYLFRGRSDSLLTCLQCQAKKTVPENMYILSLPIPEPEFNYFSIVTIPITFSYMKRLVFTLHRDATVADYIDAFEERSNFSRSDFIFCESNGNSVRKIKTELLDPKYQSKKVTDLGIVPNIALTAYEKMPKRIYFQLPSMRGQAGSYMDFYHPTENFYTICRIVESKSDAETTLVEYLSTSNEVTRVKVETPKLQSLTFKLGSKMGELAYKKIILRKYNATLKRMEYFGTEFLIGIPRWATYNEIITLVERYIENLKTREAVPFTRDEKGDYVIRLIDPTRVRCVFCLKESNMVQTSEDDLRPCCDSFEKDIPFYFAAKHKFFWVYVDWANFSRCKAAFCFNIEVDSVSKSVEKSMKEQVISLDECLKLYNARETVEMQCDKCKGKEQELEHAIGGMPNILVLHMKEFRYTPEGHLIKLDLRLKWQAFLDSSLYTPNIQGKMYELFAVVKHSGTSSSGHYTAIAKRKHPFENKKVWISFDDDVADLMSQEPPAIEDAYLLFYKKVDMPTSSIVIYEE